MREFAAVDEKIINCAKMDSIAFLFHKLKLIHLFQLNELNDDINVEFKKCFDCEGEECTKLK